MLLCEREQSIIKPMHRLLLYLDDYSELVYMETLFKKLGFDTQGVQNQRAFDESLLAMNPEVCILTARGKKVHGLDIAENLAQHRSHHKILLFAPRGLKEKLDGEQIPFVDAWVESPPTAMVLLSTLATLLHMDAKVLLEKYNKIRKQMPEVQGYQLSQETVVEKVSPEEEAEDALMLGQYPVGSTMTDQTRKQRYQQALKKLEKPTVNGFSRDKVEHWTRLIRKEERKDLLRELEEQRSSFVKALFRTARKAKS